MLTQKFTLCSVSWAGKWPLINKLIIPNGAAVTELPPDAPVLFGLEVALLLLTSLEHLACSRVG